MTRAAQRGRRKERKREGKREGSREGRKESGPRYLGPAAPRRRDDRDDTHRTRDARPARVMLAMSKASKGALLDYGELSRMAVRDLFMSPLVTRLSHPMDL